MNFVRRPIFWGICILILYVTYVISQFWLPAYGLPLDPEVNRVMNGYFAAAKMKDVATLRKYGTDDGSGLEAILFTLDKLAEFYAVNEVVVKYPHYVWPRGFGWVIWVECTGIYSDGGTWEFSAILLKTEEGWKIDHIYPKPAKLFK